MRNIYTDFEAKLVEFGSEDDHLHLLVEYTSKISISNLVKNLTGVPSRLIKQKNYPSIHKQLWSNQLCSPSYFAGSYGDVPMSIIRQYIAIQTPIS